MPRKRPAGLPSKKQILDFIATSDQPAGHSEIAGADDSGTVWGVPEQWQAETPPPKLKILERGRRGALGIGDRVLARTEERGPGFIAHPMKKLAKSAELVLGVIRQEGERCWLTPVEKKERRELPVSELKEAEPGDLVLCEISGRPPRGAVRVDAVLGDPFAPRSFSLIAIHKHGLRDVFKEEAVAEAKTVARLPLGEDRE